MKKIVKTEDETRAEYLMRVAAVFIRENASEFTIIYDDAECDGYCLADDLESELETRGHDGIGG